MKQTIIGKPQKDGAQYPQLEKRVINHGKPKTPFQLKMDKFRDYVFKKTKTYINSKKISNDDRAQIRAEARKFAKL